MRKGQHFARAFKRAVAVEYLQSGEERKAIAMKYGLPNVQTISNWVSITTFAADLSSTSAYASSDSFPLVPIQGLLEESLFFKSELIIEQLSSVDPSAKLFSW